MNNWTETKDTLTKKFSFTNFQEAFAFLTRVAFVAEKLNHHPEIHNVYNQVTLTLSTHSAGNKVTVKDYELAREIDEFLRITS